MGVRRTPPLSVAEKKKWIEAGRDCLKEKSELDSRHTVFPVPTRDSKQVAPKAARHQQGQEQGLGSSAPGVGVKPWVSLKKTTLQLRYLGVSIHQING